MGSWRGGALTGGLDAALWGNNIGQGMLYGAASGAIFAAITSPEVNNWARGKGFKNNNSVLNDFRVGKYTSEGGVWQDDALNYFGFEGKYNPTDKGPSYIKGNGDYNGFTNAAGEISYGNSAFESYDRLKAIYIKETYHSNKIHNGGSFDTQLTDPKMAPEERLGFLYLYKHQGLVPHSGIHIVSQISGYQIQTDFFGTKYKHWWDFIYKIHRRL